MFALSQWSGTEPSSLPVYDVLEEVKNNSYDVLEDVEK